ncbi:MAG: hypothetical protein F4X25_01375, partial [Chloroflexi bacterium]|nr:hypothetical protein [Chloroflexota bacterium]
MRRVLPLLGVLLLTVASIYTIWPSEPDKWLPESVPWPEGQGVSIGGFERDTMRLGLDLQGGTRLLLQGSLPEGAEGDLDDALEGSVRVLERRVNAAGLSEAEVTRQGVDSITIQIPGLAPDEARQLLGRTALLQFCEAPTGLGGGAPCGDGGQWVQSRGGGGRGAGGVGGGGRRGEGVVGELFASVGAPRISDALPAAGSGRMPVPHFVPVNHAAVATGTATA